MSTVKISELSLITQLNANTSNTLFLAVDLPTGVTGKFTGHTLAQGLYSHEVLNVGNNAVTLPNTVAQFALAGGSYVQTNLINTDNGGTADMVVTANTGTDSTYFLDAGFANKDFQPGLEFNNLGTAIYPLDGYLYSAGQEGQLGGNLVIGSTTTGTELKFIAGGHDASNIAFKATADGLKLVNGHPIYFTDNTIQNTAAAPFTYSNSSFAQANAAFILANNITTGAQSVANITMTGTSLYAPGVRGDFNTLYTTGTVSVGGDFVINGSTVYNSPTLVLSSQTQNQTIYIGSYRTANGAANGVVANSYLRFNETNKNWEFNDVNNPDVVTSYSRLLSANSISDDSTSTSISTIPTSRLLTGLYTQANAAFIKANSAYDSQNTTGSYANSGFAVANSASSYANGAFMEANSAFISQNTTGI